MEVEVNLWKFSEERTELYKAFSELDIVAVAKSSEVSFVGKKGLVQFKYADLDAILPIVKSACRKVGLAPIQFITRSRESNECVVTTHVGHVSGQWLEVILSLGLDSPDPKIFSALATYLKRYQIGAVFQISCEDDEDARDLPGPTYSGSPADKKWLVEVLTGLPYDLDKDQMKKISDRMIVEGVSMDVINVTRIIEEISKL